MHRRWPNAQQLPVNQILVKVIPRHAVHKRIWGWKQKRQWPFGIVHVSVFINLASSNARVSTNQYTSQRWAEMKWAQAPVQGCCIHPIIWFTALLYACALQLGGSGLYVSEIWKIALDFTHFINVLAYLFKRWYFHVGFRWFFKPKLRPMLHIDGPVGNMDSIAI